MVVAAVAALLAAALGGLGLRNAGAGVLRFKGATRRGGLGWCATCGLRDGGRRRTRNKDARQDLPQGLNGS